MKIITKEYSIKTSVIIPVFNTRIYLQECIESVLKQTQKEVEIILVDDGSTDGSSEVIREYEEKFPSIKAVYQSNQKLGAARNVGVRVAEGKYLYFLDSDDYIDEHLLERCYQKAEKDQLDFVLFDAKPLMDTESVGSENTVKADVYDRSNMKIGERIYSGREFWEEYYSCGGLFPNAVLVYANADFIRNNELYFEPGVYYEDNEWTLRMYLRAKRIAYISEQLYTRRYRPGSITMSSYNEAHLQSCIIICRKQVKLLEDTVDSAEQQMISSALKGMLCKFGEVFTDYIKEENHSEEITKFSTQLLQVYKKVSSISMLIGDTILKVTGIIEDKCPKWDMALDRRLRKQFIMERFKAYSLNEEEAVIGIYGTGLISRRFLAMYRGYVGEISASLIFIDTYKPTGGAYEGYPLYNIEDIGKMKLDKIIIASTRYEEEMRRNVCKYFPDARILMVPEL